MLRQLLINAIILATLTTYLVPVGNASAQSAPSDPDWNVTEVTVEKSLPGPALWKITKEDKVLWVLGVMPMQRTHWDMSRVKRLLDGAETLYLPPLSEGTISLSSTRLPEGQMLRDVISEKTYIRYRATARTFNIETKEDEQYQPFWAGQKMFQRIRLYNGISLNAVTEQVVDAAKARKVKVRRIALYDSSDTLAESTTFTTEQGEACLNYTLDSIDHLVPNRKRDAAAWARGDVDTLRARLAAAPKVTCGNNQSVRGNKARSDTLRAIEQALSGPRRNVMISSLSVLLMDDQLMHELSALGYKVIAPRSKPAP
ncbi:TraB/GumN family protein [Asticcacaulis excentricus]|uniref:TraB/GumN family protein n=1 Tax=Asticcacaulis excentricus TaxID=78587 RepID=UPI000F83C924|nr:TraB/GumN family protein [Asticcacaulis excentricus]